MSTITFLASPRAARTAPLSAEARMAAHVITAELAAEAESRMARRAVERHRERIVTRVTVAACSLAGLTAIGFAQLLLVVR